MYYEIQGELDRCPACRETDTLYVTDENTVKEEVHLICTKDDILAVFPPGTPLSQVLNRLIELQAEG